MAANREYWEFCVLNLPNGMNRSTRHGESLLIRIFISLMFGVCVFSLKIGGRHYSPHTSLALIYFSEFIVEWLTSLSSWCSSNFEWDTDARSAELYFTSFGCTAPSIPGRFNLRLIRITFNSTQNLQLFSSLTLQRSKFYTYFTFGSGYDRTETFTMFFFLSYSLSLFRSFFRSGRSIFNSLLF